MENESKKPRIQIRLGGLIILIILALILFKVDIKNKIESEQFQKNISYIEDKFSKLWKNFIILPLQTKATGWLMDVSKEGVENIGSKLINQDFLNKIEDKEKTE